MLFQPERSEVLLRDTAGSLSESPLTKIRNMRKYAYAHYCMKCREGP